MSRQRELEKLQRAYEQAEQDNDYEKQHELAQEINELQNQPEQPSRLTVRRTTYGISKRPVIMLDYHDGGELPTFDIVGGKVDAVIFNALIRAQAAGRSIEFEGFDTKEGVN